MVFIFLASFLLFSDAFINSKIIAPSDYIFTMPPWDSSMPANFQRPSNYLLFDAVSQFIPWHYYSAKRIFEGQVPLWNPYSFCGSPFLANYQSAVLYPLNLVFYILSPFFKFPSFLNYIYLFKLSLSGIFTFFFFLRLKGGKAGALVAALSFMFSGFQMFCLEHPHTNATLLLPLLLTFVAVCFESGEKYSFPVLSLSFGMLFLAGHIETETIVMFFVTLYFLYSLFTKCEPAKRVIKSVQYGISLLAGVLIAAPALFPFMEYVQNSSALKLREAGHTAGNFFELSSLTALFVPDFYGNPVYGNEWSNLAGVKGLYNANCGAYIGAAGIMLALLCVLSRWKERDIKFFSLSCLGALCIAYNFPFLSYVYRFTPVLSFMSQGNQVIVYCFSASVLAGMGTEFFINKKVGRKLMLLLASFTLIIVSCLYLWYRISVPDGVDTGTGWQILVFCFFAFSAIAISFFFTKVNTKRYVPALCIVVVILFNQIYIWKGFHPSIDKKLFYPTSGGISFINQKTGFERVAPVGDILLPNSSLIYGIRDIRGYDALSPKVYEELYNGVNLQNSFLLFLGNIPNFLQEMGVKFLLIPPSFFIRDDAGVFTSKYDKEMKIYEFNSARGRVRFVSQIDRKSMDEQNGSAEFISELPEKIEISSTSTKEGYVILSDLYYPGWKALVDNIPAEILKTNGAFRGIKVGPGKHTIFLIYDPPLFRLAAFLSLSVIIVMMGFIFCSSQNVPGERSIDLRSKISSVSGTGFAVYHIAISICCFCSAFTVILILGLSDILNFKPLSAESEIINLVTLNSYLKGKDISFYIMSIILTVIFLICGWLVWIKQCSVMERKYSIAFQSALIYDAISYLAFPAGLIFFLLNPGFSLHSLLIIVFGFYGLKLITHCLLSAYSARRKNERD